MQFANFTTVVFYMQLTVWFNSVLVMYCYFFIDNSINNFVVFVGTICCIVLRSSSIGAKYASFPSKLIQKYREVTLTIHDIRSQFIFGNWIKQDPKTIEYEAKNALLRNGFDGSIFTLSFLDTLSPKIDEDIAFLDKELEMNNTARKEIMGCNRLRVYYDGLTIFSTIVRKYNSSSDNKNPYFLIIIDTLVLSSAYIFYRLSRGAMRLYNPDSWLDTFTFYFNYINCLQVAYFTVITFSQAKLDLKRLVFIMHQITHLISTQKKPNEPVKVLPTVNFLEESSLNSWKILRRVTIDYGKKYFFRHEVYLPVVFLMSLTCLVGIFIVKIASDKFKGFLSNKEDLLEAQVCLAIWSLLLLSQTFDLLFWYGRVNEFFEFHILKLYKIRQVLSDLIKYSEFYFKSNLTCHADHKLGFNLNEVFNRKSSSHVHTRLSREIKGMLGDRLDTYLDPLLKRTISSIDSIIDEIQIDQKYKSVRILGFAIDKQLVINLFIILCTMMAALYELLMGGSSKSNF